MTGLRLDDVHFSYLPPEDPEGGEPALATPVLSGVSHCFERGSATLITGASGCGKSTLLRLLNALIPHVTPGSLRGTVTVDGLNTATAGLTEVGMRTATVFQNPRNQFFAPTVAEELAFARLQAGQPRAEVLAAVTEAAERIGLTRWLARPLRSLSGGQLQRVACGTALASPANIYLFDEPTSNLSAEAIDEIAEIMRLMRAAGATLIVAEHRLYFLRDLVDTVITMAGGQIERVWPAGEFFSLGDAQRRARGLRVLSRPEPSCTSPATAQPASGLELHDVRFSYGTTEVLRIDHLGFPPGQVTAVTGHNGAGKTTLCRIVTGLASPASGRITWQGRRVGRRARQATSSLVMQDVHRQLFAASVAEEVTTGTKTRPGLDVPALLGRLGLDQVAGRHPMSLSGGQKQRLVIASVLADEARVVVFDEPTSGVDHRHLIDIATQVRGLAAAGVAVIVVSHDIEFINACADRVVELAAPTGGGPSAITITQRSEEQP